MKINDRTFKRNDSYITSPFGARRQFKTKAGWTNSFHAGTDYGTYGQNWNIYALENGSVIWTGTDAYGAKIVWVKYPRLQKKVMYAHLNTINVKAGQTVNHDTVLGTVGKTGKATGVHLHLGLVDLYSGKYENPVWYDYTEAKVSSSYFGTKGYFSFGDTHYNIGRIANFMRRVFPAYTDRRALGNYYGKYIQASIKEFQRRTGLEADGNIGLITLKKLRQYGFKG